MKGVNIFLADGFEDIEALAVKDVLARGGVDACLVGIGDDPVANSSHGVTVVVDCCLEDVDLSPKGTSSEDFMIFPGGMPGSQNLASCAALMDAMKGHYAAGGSIAAICAAPGLVLSQLGEALKGVRFTCFDSFENAAIACGGVFEKKPAVACGRVVTGRSAGYAVDFGLEILRLLKGDSVAEKVNSAMRLDLA